jgi:hypothetical protein
MDLLYYTVLSNGGDVSPLQGPIIITNNSGSFTVNVIADLVTEGTETFQVQIRRNQFETVIVATSVPVTINDVSLTPATFAITPQTTSINEGSSVTFDVLTENYLPGVIYFTTTGIAATDVTPTSGMLTLVLGASTVTVSSAADLTTEGAETFRIQLRTGSTAGPIVATSSSITVNDTSVSPPPVYTITQNRDVSTETGLNTVFTVTTINVPNGTKLYWTVQPVFGDLNGLDFTDSDNRGEFWISNNQGTIVRTPNSILKGYVFNIQNKDTTIFSTDKISYLYWTKNKITNNMFVIEDKNNLLLNNILQPYDLSGYDFSPNSKGIKIIEPLKYKWVDPEKGELYRPLVITPPVMLNLTQKSFVFTDEKPKEIKAIVKSGKDNIQARVKAKLPQGWTIEPAFANVNLPKKGDEQIISFFIKPSSNSTIETIQFIAEIDGQTYTKGIKEIKYDHIPVQTWFPEAEAKLVKVDVKKTFNTVGYIQGAGDEVPASLEQMGYKVIIITDEQLQNGNLNEFPAIVLGVRAFNTNEKLQQYKQRVFDYVKDGGNLIVQYNTNSFFGPLKDQISPVPFKLSRDRVTIEEAPVTFLLPEHPVLNFPNKITNADFDGWIQERGIYFATDMDSSFECPLNMNDPGEKPNKGSLIIAKYGKGNYVYTGLAFFRELPAGVPGAYRLFANILSLSKNMQKLPR